MRLKANLGLNACAAGATRQNPLLEAQQSYARRAASSVRDDVPVRGATLPTTAWLTLGTAFEPKRLHLSPSIPSANSSSLSSFPIEDHAIPLVWHQPFPWEWRTCRESCISPAEDATQRTAPTDETKKEKRLRQHPAPDTDENES